MSVVAVIPPPPLQAFELGPLTVHLYGVLIAVGAFLALRLTVRRYAAVGGDPGIAEIAALLALAGGLIGARIGYVIPRVDRFLERPVDILTIWEGGLAFFGGLTGGALAVLLYVRAKHASMAAMADAVAPALPLAQAVGRWGNYFNQELFGRPTDLPWALQVEDEPAMNAGYLVERTFHPTFLYESLWNLGLVVLLLWIDRRGLLRRRGSLMFVYLIGYGIGRGWIELLRVDTVERYFGLSRNNWIAFAIVLLGIIGLRWWERRETAPSRDVDLAEAAPADAADAEPTDGDAVDAEPTDTAAVDAEPTDTDAVDTEATDTDATDAEADAPTRLRVDDGTPTDDAEPPDRG